MGESSMKSELPSADSRCESDLHVECNVQWIDLISGIAACCSGVISSHTRCNSLLEQVPDLHIFCTSKYYLSPSSRLSSAEADEGAPRCSIGC